MSLWSAYLCEWQVRKLREALFGQCEARQQVFVQCRAPLVLCKEPNRQILQSFHVTAFNYLSFEMSEAVLLVGDFHN